MDIVLTIHVQLNDKPKTCTGKKTMTITIALETNSGNPLVEQITNAVQKRIDERQLRHGTRMPSIRTFATHHKISRFTVVTAYDRLVAMGYLQSRQGSGFYVTARSHTDGTQPPLIKLDAATDVLWLLRNALAQPSNKPIPGAGWLPSDWMDERGIQRSLRLLSKRSGRFLTSYGQPAGYAPLRDWLQHRLSEIGIHANSSQIFLTRSATHALDLISRYLVRPNDRVLVDDPGYFLLFGALKSLGAQIIGVPWNHDGPDTVQMERLIQEHKPNVFFTNTILHNPTGATISQSTAYRVLQLAERYNLTIVEDDIYGDFHPGHATRLATLDQLQRVIYLSSYSKTISASLRVGYIACSPKLAPQLIDLKLLTGMTTSEIDERVIHQMLTDGYYRKHLNNTRKKLQQGREQAMEYFERLKLPLYVEPEGGMFIWVKLPENINTIEMANRAAEQGITLAPGNLFKPDQQPTPWMRFNVASCHEPALIDFLNQQLAV